MHSLLSTRNGETQRLGIEDRHVGFASGDTRDLIKKSAPGPVLRDLGPGQLLHRILPPLAARETKSRVRRKRSSAAVLPPCRPQTAQTVELDKVLAVILNQPWLEFSIYATEPKPVATAIARESIRDDDDEVYLPGYSPSRSTMQPVGWPSSPTASDSN
jgi:hypothetical protein